MTPPLGNVQRSVLPPVAPPTVPVPAKEAETSAVIPPASDPEVLDDDDFSPELLAELENYKSPPPKRVFTIKVRYRFVGKGKPTPYPLDEDELDLLNELNGE